MHPLYVIIWKLTASVVVFTSPDNFDKSPFAAEFKRNSIEELALLFQYFWKGLYMMWIWSLNIIDIEYNATASFWSSNLIEQ